MEGLDRRKAAVRALLPPSWSPVVEVATASAPVNIALAKYWGKRDEELHLPITDSFSVALNLKTTTTVRQATAFDEVTLNDTTPAPESAFYRRLTRFLDLFRPTPSFAFSITTTNSVPTAAGLASSASGFAALTMALNTFFGWNLDRQKLSCLSRLGSGSACRSIYSGFVRWQKGSLSDGSDSYAIPIDDWWPDLHLSILTLSSQEKPLSSREAMRRSVTTSPVYALWPAQVMDDTTALMEGLRKRNFTTFGMAAEKNALMMHATMLTATPPFCYWLEETMASIHTVWQARKNGVQVYFTMDAGPNIKLLYLRHDENSVLKYFPEAVFVPLLPPS